MSVTNVQESYAAYLARRDKAIIFKRMKSSLPVWEEAFKARRDAGYKFIPLAEMQAIYNKPTHVGGNRRNA